MTSALQVFSYEDSQIRTYTDENGEVWLVAKDVCDFLEIANARDAVSSLDDDEKADVAISDGSQRRHYNVINEAGLYKLTFRSRKPEAKKFTRWVTHEVLPQIRKTGSYIAPEVEESEEVLEPLNIRVRIAGVLQRLALQVSDEAIRDHINRESYKYATGETLPDPEPKPKAASIKHNPRHWTAQQIGATLKWPPDAVMHRAENLGLTKNPVNGYWDGETWYFSKEGRQKFIDLVRAKIVKIEGGYEYYENGYKRIHWSFDPDAARF